MAEQEPKDIKIVNPSGVVTVVPASYVTRHNLFANGFRKVNGEKYPKEVNDAWKQYTSDMESRGLIVTDAVVKEEENGERVVEREAGVKETKEAAAKRQTDQSDPQQPDSEGDKKRRGDRAAKALKQDK